MPHEGSDYNQLPGFSGNAPPGTIGGVGGWGESPAPPPDLLAAFKDMLAKYNPRFFEASDAIGGLANTFSAGNINALQDAREKGTLGMVSERFGRMGTGNTGAELNALTRARSGFGTDRLQALMSGAQAQSGLIGQSLDPLNQGFQNQTIEEQLRIMAESARNAGQGGGGGDSGGRQCTLICLILTDLLHSKGDLTDEQFIRHAKVSRLKSNPAMYAGYLAWAAPLSRQEWAYPLILATIRPYVLDVTGERPSWAGKAVGWAMRSFSALLGNLLFHVKHAHGR